MDYLGTGGFFCSKTIVARRILHNLINVLLGRSCDYGGDQFADRACLLSATGIGLSVEGV